MRLLKVILAAFLAVIIYAPTLEAQDRFNTAEACLAAIADGTARSYVPTYLKPLPLQAGEEERPLEHGACVRMQIVGAIAWVPQVAGTCFVFKDGAPVRRCDCGNKVYGIVYPYTPAQQMTTMLEPASPMPSDTIFMKHIGTVEVHSVTIPDQSPFPWLPVGIGTAVVGGLIYMCITDWCAGDEETRASAKVNVEVGAFLLRMIR